MKLDTVILMLIGVVILLIVLGLGTGVVMVFMGGEENTTENDTLIKYQCYNGEIVSKLSKCPALPTSTQSSVLSTVSCPPTTSCPKCNCQGSTMRTTIPTTTLCTPCVSSTSCGSSTSELICRNGDSWRVTYNPSCSNGCCIFVSSPALNRECADNEICQSGSCVNAPSED